jgi:hypothetical protein
MLILGLLAMSIAAPGTYAQTAPAATPPAASAVDPAAVQALKDMGAYLQSLKRFRVSTEVTGERVLADGQKLQHMASAKLDVARPDRLRAVIASARSQRELVFDGNAVTLFAAGPKHYAKVEFTGTIGGVVEQLEARHGVQFPLADLFI